MIVLDTNVASEVMKPEPAAQVLSWIAAYPRERVFITTITQAEILYGVEILPAGKRRAALQAEIDAMLNVEFAGRILPFDERAARAFSRIAAERRTSGRPIAVPSMRKLQRWPSRAALRSPRAMSTVSTVAA
jgi:toxin FitB